MKSTVSDTPCTKEKPFPKLMISKSGALVLFSKPEHGTAVVPGKYHKIGDYSTGWAMNTFTDFDGSVCLENDK